MLELEVILTFLSVFALSAVAIFCSTDDHPIDRHREAVRSQRRLG
jgi:hypothetical protein